MEHGRQALPEQRDVYSALIELLIEVKIGCLRNFGALRSPRTGADSSFELFAESNDVNIRAAPDLG